MAISKVQPMRPAEIELVDNVNTMLDDISDLERGLEETNTVVGQLSQELGQEIENRTQADTALGGRIDTVVTDLADETQARTQADTALGGRIDTVVTDLAAIPTFEYGTTQGETVLANGTALVSISFTDTKESTPYVLITLESDEANTYIANSVGVVSSVTASGFNVRLHNNSADDAVIVINWLAIGE